MNNPSIRDSGPEMFISCGMYAFTEPLRQAWQALFDRFLELSEYAPKIRPGIVFDGNLNLLGDDCLFIGHTCGYPLMRYLQDSVAPICVPVFGVTGCQSTLYSSVFIVPENSDACALTDCYQRVAVINGFDSNSGMNVFRHAIADLKAQTPYFSSVRETGSHLQSLKEIAFNRADIAAIDCVSFALIKDAWPELVARVRPIAYSAQTCGLPFVVPVALRDQIDSTAIISNLNLAVQQLSDRHRKALHLSHFEGVSLVDYACIPDLENQAIEANYPVII